MGPNPCWGFELLFVGFLGRYIPYMYRQVGTGYASGYHDHGKSSKSVRFFFSQVVWFLGILLDGGATRCGWSSGVWILIFRTLLGELGGPASFDWRVWDAKYVTMCCIILTGT